MLRKLLGQAHRHLPRPRDGPAATLTQHICVLNVVVLGHGSLDIVHADLSILNGDEVS